MKRFAFGRVASTVLGLLTHESQDGTVRPLAIAQGFGHPMKTFGNPTLCEGGALKLG